MASEAYIGGELCRCRLKRGDVDSECGIHSLETGTKTAQKRELHFCNSLIFSVVSPGIEPGTQGFSVLNIAIVTLLIFIILTLEQLCWSKLFGKQRVSSWLNLYILFSVVGTTFNQFFYLLNECFSLWVKFIKHFLVTVDKIIIVTAMSFFKKCCKYFAC